MKTVIIDIHCSVCKKFKIEHTVDINEYGFFAIPDGYCPHCFNPLVQDIHAEKNEWIEDARSNTPR